MYMRRSFILHRDFTLQNLHMTDDTVNLDAFFILLLFVENTVQVSIYSNLSFLVHSFNSKLLCMYRMFGILYMVILVLY